MYKNESLISACIVFIAIIHSCSASELVEFMAPDTAQGDIQTFEMLVNNSGNTHLNATVHIEIFKSGIKVGNLTAKSTKIYSRRSASIRLDYNTSPLKVGEYQATATLGNSSISKAFKILEYHEELVVKGLKADPVKVGEPLLINLVLENTGNVDLDYDVIFSIKDKFDNKINGIPLKGSLSKFAATEIQTAWKTAEKQPNSYEITEGDYIVKADLNYGKKGSGLRDMNASLSIETMLIKENNAVSLHLFMLLISILLIIAIMILRKNRC